MASRTPFQADRGRGRLPPQLADRRRGVRDALPHQDGRIVRGRARRRSGRARWRPPLARVRPPATAPPRSASLAGRAQAMRGETQQSGAKRRDAGVRPRRRRVLLMSTSFGESLSHRIASRLFGTTCSGALEREGQHLVDRTRAEHHHQQSIDAERHARAVGQPRFERGEEALVGRRHRQAATASLLAVAARSAASARAASASS